MSLGHPRIENIGIHGAIDLLQSINRIPPHTYAWHGAGYSITEEIKAQFISLERGRFPYLKTIRLIEGRWRLTSLPQEHVILWEGIENAWKNDGVHVGEEDFPMD